MHHKTLAVAADNNRSTVNYRQPLAFNRTYLSFNDHCDRWLFQEILLLLLLLLLLLFRRNSFERS